MSMKAPPHLATGPSLVAELRGSVRASAKSVSGWAELQVVHRPGIAVQVDPHFPGDDVGVQYQALDVSIRTRRGLSDLAAIHLDGERSSVAVERHQRGQAVAAGRETGQHDHATILAVASGRDGDVGVFTTAAGHGVDDDEAAIRATIQHYFNGGMEVREAFWPDTRMLHMRDGELRVAIEDYISRVEARADEPPPADVSKKILSIDRSGDAAVAKLELNGPDWLLNDYMSLLKIVGEWL